MTTVRSAVEKTLRRERPDPLPWLTRLDLWHTSRQNSGNMPPELAGMDLMEIHRHLGIGRQRHSSLTRKRLRGVDLTVEFGGQVVRRESDPLIGFPTPTELVVKEPGDTDITLETPAGRVHLRYQTNEEVLRDGSTPYLVEHILKDDDDFQVVKWILSRLEILTNYEDFSACEASVGDHGFTIGMMERVPFQRILLDFMGEEATFYYMADSARKFQYLLDALTDQGRQVLELALGSPALLVELPDNYEGMMTSPRLFKQYCIPFSQEVADAVHAAGRFLGSHMDGNMKPLLQLVPEAGIDVVESFSAAPLTQLAFADAWQAWRDKVIMWGAIPSPIFEPHIPQNAFETWVQEMLHLVGEDGLIILGIGDQALGTTLIERVKIVSQMLGRL